MQSLGSAIAKLKKLRDALADPSPFFEAQLAGRPGALRDFERSTRDAARRWIGIAQATARDVIFFSLPADEDPTEWGFLADYIASQVGIILAAGGHGVIIFLGEHQAEFSFATLFGSPAAAGASLTLEQVTDYVEAGLRGDPAGKPDISEHDQEISAQRTAFNILKAFHQRGFSGAREQEIVKFVETRALQKAEEFLPAIEAAWGAMFAVVAVDDFKIWVERTARAALA